MKTIIVDRSEGNEELTSLKTARQGRLKRKREEKLANQIFINMNEGKEELTREKISRRKKKRGGRPIEDIA